MFAASGKLVNTFLLLHLKFECITKKEEKNMLYQFFLIAACFLQVFAAVIAIKLTRVTKYNVSWMLICAGLVTMSLRSIINIVRLFGFDFGPTREDIYAWGGIFVSFCFAIGVYLIKHIFIYIRKANVKERQYEKRLLRTMIQTEENERKRFATELHDGLGPQLSSIKMSFSAIAKDITDVEVRKNLEQAIAEAITTVREVSNNLSPHILDNFGLDKAVRNFVAKMNIPKEITVEYNISIGDQRYQATKEIVMYRVFCELLNNTLRHAQATKVTFSIWEENNALWLRYADNGIGFEPTQMDEQKFGLGYYNVMSRVSSLKGKVKFDRPENGQGTQIEVKIPIYDNK